MGGGSKGEFLNVYSVELAGKGERRKVVGLGWARLRGGDSGGGERGGGRGKRVVGLVEVAGKGGRRGRGRGGGEMGSEGVEGLIVEWELEKGGWEEGFIVELG